MTGVRGLAVLIAGGLLAGPGTAAQSGAVRLGLVSSRVERIAPVTGTQALTGIGWTLEGAFGIGPATLGVRYLQTPVSNDSTPDAIDLVEGEALLWFAPIHWVDVGLGPHLRAYAQGGGTERWVLWELRVRGNAVLFGPAIAAYAEGWRILGASVDAAESFNSGGGLEGGLRFVFGRFPLGGSPLSVRVRYRVERLNLGDGLRRETVEQLGVAFGIGRR